MWDGAKVTLPLLSHVNGAPFGRPNAGHDMTFDFPALIAHALGVVARTEGMGEIAKQAGLTRPSLYKALSENGRPEFSTVLKVVRALGLKLTVAA